MIVLKLGNIIGCSLNSNMEIGHH